MNRRTGRFGLITTLWDLKIVILCADSEINITLEEPNLSIFQSFNTILLVTWSNYELVFWLCSWGSMVISSAYRLCRNLSEVGCAVNSIALYSLVILVTINDSTSGGLQKSPVPESSYSRPTQKVWENDSTMRDPFTQGGRFPIHSAMVQPYLQQLYAFPSTGSSHQPWSRQRAENIQTEKTRRRLE